MGNLKYTPWFHVDKDGLPVRPGVYEGTSAGIPGKGFVAFHGYYLWDGMRWAGFGDSPDKIRNGAHTVKVWRGVIPGKDYPFDPVSAPQSHYSGVLERAGASDRLIVHRLTVKGGEMIVSFSRERGGREPEKYEAALHQGDNDFEGASKIKIGNFVEDSTAKIRIPSFFESEGRIILSLLLRGATRDWFAFDGVLKSSG